MQEIFSNIYELIINLVNYLGVYGPILGCFLIIIESIVPVLPLFVFITMNTLAFGKIFGFLLSWLCTIIGCLLSYFLTKKLGAKYVEKRLSDKSLLKKFLKYIKNLTTQQITVIMAIPFTPAFVYNIAAGLANMKFSKFLVTIIISKIFLVYFWGTIGTGLIESLKHPQNLIIVAIMMLIAYIASVIINKLFKIN